MNSMNWATALLITATSAAILCAAEAKDATPAAGAKYSQDFSQAAPGDPPEDIMVLEGQFTVREEAGNRLLELPGAPLETFGVLFGPSTTTGFQAQARVWGKKEGRKQPVFALGLNGQGGLKLRLSPAKQALELMRGDDVLASVPFQWKSGEWTALRLQTRPAGTGVLVEGKAWQGDKEPANWSIKQNQTVAPPAGKAGVWGLPFSGTPLRFDDFKVVPAG